MDTLTLKGLRYDARHGYYNYEREKGNRFEVDLIFDADLRRPAGSDELEETIDYEKAEQIVADIMEGPPVKLIETLADKIGTNLFSEFTLAQSLEVRVRKMDPPMASPAKYSEVSMSWQR